MFDLEPPSRRSMNLRPLPLLLFVACVPPPPAPGIGQDSGVMFKDKGVIQMPPDDAGEDPKDADVVVDTGPFDTGIFPDAGVMLPDLGVQADADGDGIPNAEDPNPGYQNPMLLMDTFSDESGGWIFSSVSMEISTNESLLRVPNVEPFEREGWVGPRPNWSDVFVRTIFRVTDVGLSGDRDSGYAALIARVNQVTPSRYVACGLDTKNDRVLLAEYEGTSRTILATADVTVDEGDWHLLDFTADGAFYSCKIAGAEATASSAVFFSGSIGFRTFDAAFEADWIEVYELQL